MKEVRIMKKILSIVLAILLIASLALGIAGCDLLSSVVPALGNSVAGTYYFEEMTQDGETVAREDLEYAAELSGMDLNEFLYLQLNDDGTGVMSMMGEEMEMAYEDGKIWPVGDEDEKIPFTVKGNTLTIEQDDMKMVFKK